MDEKGEAWAVGTVARHPAPRSQSIFGEEWRQVEWMLKFDLLLN